MTNGMTRNVGWALAVVAIGVAGVGSAALACTGITIKPKDGAVIFARTLEFAMDLKSAVIVVPRGLSQTGSTPDGQPGLRWTSRYGSVGMNAFGRPVIVDGLNETGLHIGLFYFPDYAGYQTITPAERDRALAPFELGRYLLDACANVDEAVAAARRVRVGAVILQEFGFVPGCHYILTDSSGGSVVLEFVEGSLKVHENPLGVITNAPTFDWHMTNLANFINLSVTNVPPLNVDGTKLRGFGQGSGLVGLPGDFTPPSRFVRAAVFSRSALPVDSAREGVLQAFHILNQFDIPKGAARGVEHGREVADYTLWTAASDLKNLHYYYRTYANSRIHVVDLKAASLDAKTIRTIPISGDESFEDVTGKVK